MGLHIVLSGGEEWRGRGRGSRNKGVRTAFHLVVHSSRLVWCVCVLMNHHPLHLGEERMIRKKKKGYLSYQWESCLRLGRRVVLAGVCSCLLACYCGRRHSKSAAWCKLSGFMLVWMCACEYCCPGVVPLNINVACVLSAICLRKSGLAGGWNEKK